MLCSGGYVLIEEGKAYDVRLSGNTISGGRGSSEGEAGGSAVGGGRRRPSPHLFNHQHEKIKGETVYLLFVPETQLRRHIVTYFLSPVQTCVSQNALPQRFQAFLQARCAYFIIK